MNVRLRLDEQGGVCSFALENVDPGVAGLQACVERTFREPSYPAPEGGCAEVTLGLVFQQKKNPEGSPP